MKTLSSAILTGICTVKLLIKITIIYTNVIMPNGLIESFAIERVHSHYSGLLGGISIQISKEQILRNW